MWPNSVSEAHADLGRWHLIDNWGAHADGNLKAQKESSVQFSHSVVSKSLWPHEPQHARPLGPSPATEVHPNPCPLSQWCHPTNHLILCCPLLLLPSIFPSIRVFSNELALHIRWPKYWNFSFSISPSKEYSGLISFRIDWFDLLAVQGTLKSLLQFFLLLFSLMRMKIQWN